MYVCVCSFVVFRAVWFLFALFCFVLFRFIMFCFVLRYVVSFLGCFASFQFVLFWFGWICFDSFHVVSFYFICLFVLFCFVSVVLCYFVSLCLFCYGVVTLVGVGFCSVRLCRALFCIVCVTVSIVKF